MRHHVPPWYPHEILTKNILPHLYQHRNEESYCLRTSTPRTKNMGMCICIYIYIWNSTCIHIYIYANIQVEKSKNHGASINLYKHYEKLTIYRYAMPSVTSTLVTSVASLPHAVAAAVPVKRRLGTKKQARAIKDARPIISRYSSDPDFFGCWKWMDF